MTDLAVSKADAGYITPAISESEKIKRARININHYMEYVFQIEQAQLHSEWHSFIQENTWCMILAAQFHGKCCTGDTLVQLYNGSFSKIKDISKNTSIVSYNSQNNSFEKDFCSGVFENGERKIFEINTRSGRQIKCTGNHPFYTFSGTWKNAFQLSEYDFLPIAKDLYFKPRCVETATHIFIGYMIGDGCCKHSPKFTTKDKLIAKHFENVCSLLNVSYRYNKERYCYILRQPSDNILKEFSLLNETSYTKRVPKQIFKLPISQLSEFIGAYFACDGTVDKNRLEVSFSSVSKDLLLDISNLLLRFGIVSVLKLKKGIYSGKKHLSWRLTIRGNMVIAFKNKISFAGEKNYVLRDICERLEQRKFSRSWINVVPPEWRNFLKSSDKQLFEKINYGKTSNGNDIELAKKVAYIHSNDELYDRLNAPIFWDRVVGINILPPEKTYFISVEKNKKNNTNGFITHNSTQITLGIPTFGLGKNPNLRFGIVRQSEPFGHSAISAISETIEENERYHKVFPDVVPNKKRSWKLDRLTIKRDRTDESPSVHSMGITSAPSGRKDWLIFDDPCTYVNSIQQPKLRESIKKNSWTPFKNLLGPHGRLTYICTPYHEDDLTGTLRKHKAFAGKVFAKGINRNFDPIWPEVWPREALIDWYEKEINPREFWRAFGLETISADEQLITREQMLALRIPFFPIPRDWPKFTGVDLAIVSHTGKSENKRTSVFTIAVDPDTKYRYPVDIQYGKFSSPDTARLLVAVNQQFNPQVICVESNNYQYALKEWVGLLGIPGAEATASKIYPYFTTSEKTDPVLGLPGLAGEWVRGMWRIPCDMEDHSSSCKCGVCQWIQEATTYPIGAFSDVLMSSWLAMKGAHNLSNAPSILFLGQGSRRKKLYEML